MSLPGVAEIPRCGPSRHGGGWPVWAGNWAWACRCMSRSSTETIPKEQPTLERASLVMLPGLAGDQLEFLAQTAYFGSPRQSSPLIQLSRVTCPSRVRPRS